MIVRQEYKYKERFVVTLTLDEYKLLKCCDKNDNRGMSEALKAIIDAGIHQD